MSGMIGIWWNARLSHPGRRSRKRSAPASVLIGVDPRQRSDRRVAGFEDRAFPSSSPFFPESSLASQGKILQGSWEQAAEGAGRLTPGS